MIETIYPPSHTPATVVALEVKGQVECVKARRHSDYRVRLTPPR